MVKLSGVTRIANEAHFYSRRATNFSPEVGDTRGPGEESAAAFTLTRSKSHQQQKKNLKKKQNPKLKREYRTKPRVSLVKPLCNIPNIMLLDYDTAWGGVGEGITVKPILPTLLPSGYNTAGVLTEPAVSQLLW